MSPGVGDRLQRGLADLAPLLTAFTALFADLVPLGTLAPANVTQSLLLVVAFYWSVHRPDLLTSLDLFALGLLADLLGDTPLGVTALVLLVMRRMVLIPQRPMLARSFLLGWLGFTATLTALALLRWLVMGFVHQSLFPLPPIAVEACLTAMLYPPLAAGLALLAPKLSHPARA